jgi:hypothetical protein
VIFHDLFLILLQEQISIESICLIWDKTISFERERGGGYVLPIQQAMFFPCNKKQIISFKTRLMNIFRSNLTKISVENWSQIFDYCIVLVN